MYAFFLWFSCLIVHTLWSIYHLLGQMGIGSHELVGLKQMPIRYPLVPINRSMGLYWV